MAVETAFDTLLATWRAHHNRQQRDNVPLRELARSRAALDVARQRMHQLRTTMYPEGDDLESIVTSVWCESLEIVVHLRWTDRHPTRPGNFSCPCGHLVPIDWDASV